MPNDDERTIFGIYWTAYGGWGAWVRSPFLWLSVALLVPTYNFWFTKPWWDQVISVLPNLLGFTLGGFAVFLSLGDEKFKSVISGADPAENGAPSPYLAICASFLHFVLVQGVALLFAIVVKATSFDATVEFAGITHPFQATRFIADAFGYWLFIYGLSLACAAALGIFQVAHLFDEYQTRNKDKS